MQVTSETLFHFTTSLKNLQNILSKKFNLTYCNEKFTLNNENHDYYFPMISFCDIPLALAKDQIDKYGSYAIGLTKEWGIRNQLNPVVYLEKNSLLAQDIQDDIDKLFNIVKAISSTDNKHIEFLKIKIQAEIANFPKALQLDSSLEKKVVMEVLISKIDNLFDDTNLAVETSMQIFSDLEDLVYSKLNFYRYVKNYQGTLFRQNKPIRNYRFYDEREWRYVPAISDTRIEANLNEEQYRKYRGNSISKPLIDKIILNFTSEDIKFLIVKSNKDVPKLIHSIERIDNLTKNANDASILTTKILTVEQLNNDF